jgi:hypothetical protein
VGMNLEHECYIGKNSEKKLYKVSAGMASTPRHGGVYSPTWSWPGLAALFLIYSICSKIGACLAFRVVNKN